VLLHLVCTSLTEQQYSIVQRATTQGIIVIPFRCRRVLEPKSMPWRNWPLITRAQTVGGRHWKGCPLAITDSIPEFRPWWLFSWLVCFAGWIDFVRTIGDKLLAFGSRLERRGLQGFYITVENSLTLARKHCKIITCKLLFRSLPSEFGKSMKIGIGGDELRQLLAMLSIQMLVLSFEFPSMVIACLTTSWLSQSVHH